MVLLLNSSILWIEAWHFVDCIFNKQFISAAYDGIQQPPQKARFLRFSPIQTLVLIQPCKIYQLSGLQEIARIG